MNGPETLRAIGGWLTLAGAGLFGLAWLTSTLPREPVLAGVEVSRWVAVPAHILVLLALGSIYLAQAETAGGWGLTGFLLAFGGASIFLGYVIGGWTAVIPEPVLGPVAGAVWLTGMLILAVVNWQGGTLPQWAGVLWFVGAVAYATGVPAGPDQPPKVTALMGALAITAGIGWAGLDMILGSRS
jgi:hypothetical protein